MSGVSISRRISWLTATALAAAVIWFVFSGEPELSSGFVTFKGAKKGESSPIVNAASAESIAIPIDRVQVMGANRIAVVDDRERALPNAFAVQMTDPGQRWAVPEMDLFRAGDLGVIVLPPAVVCGSSLSVAADGFQSRVVEVEGGMQRVVLSQGAELYVRTLDAQGQPLSGVLIATSGRVLPRHADLNEIGPLALPCGTADKAIRRTVTNATGEAAFYGLPPGQLYFSVSKPGWLLVDLEPPIARAPGSVVAKLEPLRVAGVAIRGGIPLSSRVTGIAPTTVMSGECADLRDRLIERFDLIWCAVVLESQVAQKSTEDAATVSVLVEQRGWLSASVRFKTLDEFAPEVIEVSPSAPVVPSAPVLVQAGDAAAGGYQNLLRDTKIKLVPQSGASTARASSARPLGRRAGILLGINERKLLPAGTYDVEVEIPKDAVLTVTPQVIELHDQHEIVLTVKPKGPFTELALRLEDAAGIEFPSGAYRMRPTAGGRTISALVFNGWSTARPVVLSGEYSIVLQGGDGSIATAEILCEPRPAGAGPQEVTLRIGEKGR